MRAELKRLHSPDIDDLKAYTPEEPDSFGFLLQAMMGPAGREGEESFDIVVCTPEWLKRKHTATEIILGRHQLIVFTYDYQRLASYIAAFAERCTGESWQDVAQQLSRLGKWEFEDYREYTGD
jgi:hypothetical protein